MEFAILEFGTAKVEAKLLEGADKAASFEAAMAEISADMFRVEKTIFSSGGRRGGGSWAALKPDTATRKGSSTILVDSGQLYNSVTEPGAEFQILEIANHSLVFGTDRPWAFVQQFGSKYNNRPARPFIRFLPTDVSRWTRILFDHLMEPFIA